MRRKRQQLAEEESIAILEKATGNYTSIVLWLAIRLMPSASAIRHLSVSLSRMMFIITMDGYFRLGMPTV